jgi:hypothetical protein
LRLLFLCTYIALTAHSVSAQVNTESKDQSKLDFAQLIGPDACPGITPFADPYVLQEGSAWYLTSTYPLNKPMYMFKTTDWKNKKPYSLKIDANKDYLRDHFHTKKMTPRALWGFTPYKHTDHSWHAYGSISVGNFKTFICHFLPVGGSSWPITHWKLDKVLLGGLSSQTYETKVYADATGLYLLYVDHLDDGNNHIMAQKLLDPNNLDTSFKARAILSPEGLRSEDRNEPGSMQICEGTNISHVTLPSGSKYVMFYSVGDFALSNYKLAVAYSDVLIPPAGKKYIKPKLKDRLNVWQNPQPAHEVAYLLQTQKKQWPNYCAPYLNGPGLGNLVKYRGNYYIVFHAHNPIRTGEGGAGRWTWICPVTLDFSAADMDQWISPVLPDRSSSSPLRKIHYPFLSPSRHACRRPIEHLHPPAVQLQQ